MATNWMRVVLFTALLILILSLPWMNSNSQEETITKKDRDIILLMCALENPNYDIVLAIDVSGSMNKVLPEWKKMAETTVDIAQLGDTLVLLKFDSAPKMPIIQKIEKERDKELFKGYVRNTTTTTGWGTDINRAYWLILKTLRDFNEARKKSGEPIRLAQVVFISDGDDLPPANSPFRNPASPETLEMGDLVKDAQRLRIINVIPIGMEFKNYVPQTRKIQKEGATPVNEKISKELKEFIDKLQNVLNRPYEEIKEDQEKISRAPYQFYIDWLSNRLILEKAPETRSKKPTRKIINLTLVSGFRKVNVKNMSVAAQYKGSGNGRVTALPTLPGVLTPGSAQRFSAVVRFPKNWGFVAKKYEGVLDVTVTGLMAVQFDETVKPTSAAPGATPAPPKKSIVYTYPLEPKTIRIPLSGKLPPAIELYLAAGCMLMALLVGLGTFIYRKATPITITLKTESHARAFKISNTEAITIGGSSDFELDGCREPVASIKRGGSLFFLIIDKEGVLADSPDGKRTGKFELRYGQSFNFNIDGTYHTIQFLEGDQEDAVSPDESHTDTYVDDDEGGGFSF